MKAKNEYGYIKKRLFKGKNEADFHGNHKKGGAMAMALIMLFAIFVSLSALMPTASAQSQIPTYYGWAGYEGNQTIYLTSSITNTNQMFLPSSSLGSLAVQQPGNGNLQNAVAVGVGGSASTPNGNSIEYEEYYANGQMFIFIPVTAVGSSNWTYLVTPSNEGGPTTTTISGIDYEELSMNVPMAYPSTVITPYTGYTYGINVSSTYVTGTNYSQVEWATVWYLLGLLPDGMGPVISTANLENSFYGEIQNNPNSQVTHPGNDTQGKYGMDMMMTQTGNYVGSYSENWGYDTYGITTMYQLNINQRDFLNSSKLTIGAQNIEETNSNGIVTTSNGAYSNVQINVVPAYTIQGYTYLDGVKEGNQTLLIEDTTNNTNFYVRSNSTGFYRFFANPNDTYQLMSPISSTGAIPISPDGSTGGENLPVYLNSIIFESSSNLDGNSWSVELTGPTGTSYTSPSTTSSSIEFGGMGNNGSYNYDVLSPGGWSASPSSGSFNLGSASQTISISFIPTSYYTVQFSESGSGGNPWGVTLNGNTKTTTGSSISYSEPNGYFSFSALSNVKGSNGDTYEWSASPSSGMVHVNGGMVTTSIHLTLDGVESPQSSGGVGGSTGCVNGTTQILLANGTYMQAQDLSIVGSYVLTYNLTTHSYHAEEVKDLYITHLHRQYDINGMLNVSAYQPILTNHGYVTAQNLTTKDMMYNALTRSFVQITGITVYHGNFTMYDFNIPPDYDFIAGHFVVYDATIQP